MMDYLRFDGKVVGIVWELNHIVTKRMYAHNKMYEEDDDSRIGFLKDVDIVGYS